MSDNHKFEQAKLLYENAVNNIDRIKNNEFKLIISISAATAFLINVNLITKLGCMIKLLYTLGIIGSVILLILSRVNLRKHRTRIDNVCKEGFSYLNELRKENFKIKDFKIINWLFSPLIYIENFLIEKENNTDNNQLASPPDLGDNTILLLELLYLISLLIIFWQLN